MIRCVRVAVLAGLILSMIVSMLALTAAPALAQGGNTVTVNTGAAHVRSGPSLHTTALGSVSGGTVLPVTGRSTNSGWWRVTSSFGTGWVSAELVIFSGVLNTVPVVNQPAGTYEAPTVIVDRFPATVYRNPNADSFIVGISPTGAVLTVMGRSIDGNWWQVQTPLGAGWVNAGEVAFRGEETLVERVGDPGPSFDGPTIRVNADVVVTTQPGGGDVIATLAAGTAVPATGRNADNTWWQVTGVFGIGWIPVSAVSLAGASDYIRIVSDTGVDGPVYTGAAFATAVVEVERKVAYAEGGFSSAPMWAA
ncbi:MAG: SH3 domain-containing protein, partial [Chloroflexi bacterium]|nr:SH3 domain-containing protein [Chloroflexota bacterium]